jgi:hypothetical protein
VRLEEVSDRVSKVARNESLDTDALVDEAIRWHFRRG